MKTTRIGILALQGDISEHVTILENAAEKRGIPIEVPEIKKSTDLDGLNGLIIPGGESTTMTRLMGNMEGKSILHLKSRIQEMANNGLPIFGICAGAILLAKNVLDRPSDAQHPGTLDLMDVTILRNAYGRQQESFETSLLMPNFGETHIPGVFIRAPIIQKVNNDVEVLGSLEKDPVLVKQGNLLAATFHPELTDDLRIVDYFLNMCESYS